MPDQDDAARIYEILQGYYRDGHQNGNSADEIRRLREEIEQNYGSRPEDRDIRNMAIRALESGRDDRQAGKASRSDYVVRGIMQDFGYPVPSGVRAEGTAEYRVTYAGDAGTNGGLATEVDGAQATGRTNTQNTTERHA